MYRRTVLSNGVTVLTESVTSVRSIAVGILVDAGPQDDPLGKQGLAHLTEHLFFQGTTSRNGLAISRFIDSAGGQMGAFTSRDYTCFYANVLDEYCTYGMELLGDILVNSTFPDGELEREKGAILREIALGNDSPVEQVNDLIKASVWPNHPLGQLIAGTPASVSSMTRDDVVDFVTQNYTPDRVIAVAAGAISHETFVGLVEDALWKLDGKPVARNRTPCVYQPAVVFESMPVSQVYFSVGLPMSNYTDEHRYGEHVICSILGGGLSSRLFSKLREQLGLVYGIQSELHAYRQAGMLVIEACCAPENFLFVLSQIMTELYQLALGDPPIDEEELWRAKMQIRGQHLLAADAMNTRMSRLATQQFYFGRPFDEQEVLQQIESITSESLETTTLSRLQRAIEQVTLVAVGPDLSASHTEDQAREMLDQFRQLSVCS